MHKNSLKVEIPQYFEIDFLNLFTGKAPKLQVAQSISKENLTKG